LYLREGGKVEVREKKDSVEEGKIERIDSER